MLFAVVLVFDGAFEADSTRESMVFLKGATEREMRCAPSSSGPSRIKLMRSLFPLPAPVALLAWRGGPLLPLAFASPAGILGTGGMFSATIAV